MGEEDSYKYVGTLYTHHFSGTIYFFCFFFFFFLFFFLQVCLWAIYDMKLKFHSYSTTSCEYDNVEVKEKIASKDVGVFLFYFLHSNLFLDQFPIFSYAILFENRKIQ